MLLRDSEVVISEFNMIYWVGGGKTSETKNKIMYSKWWCDEILRHWRKFEVTKKENVGINRQCSLYFTKRWFLNEWKINFKVDLEWLFTCASWIFYDRQFRRNFNCLNNVITIHWCFICSLWIYLYSVLFRENGCYPKCKQTNLPRRVKKYL